MLELSFMVTHADVVAFLHCDPAPTDPEERLIFSLSNDVPAKLIIAKNRNGAVGTTIDLVFHPQWYRFDLAPRIDDADIPE